jgi:hypothetical protein
VRESDPGLASLLEELKVRAGKWQTRRAQFEVQRLQLALGRVERDIAAARRSGGDIGGPARRREELRQAYDAAMDRSLEHDRLPAE